MSEELGLPLFYQEYPEYFDTPANIYNSSEKNRVIENLLKEYKIKSIFDMTCGTGSQVFHLARLGYDITGADFSPALLEIARDKAAKQNLDVKFIDGDIRKLQSGSFDAVITIDNAIGHLVKKDFAIAIRNISQNLKEDGVYIFDILNLEAMTDEVIEADSNRMTDSRETSDGTVIRNERTAVIDRKHGYLNSVNNITIIKKNGEQERVKNKCSLQIYSMQELNDILASNGFEMLKQIKVDAYTFHKDENGYSIMNVARKVG